MDHDSAASGRSSIFSEKDYDSGEGFQTPTWGPAAWHMLHTTSFNYPVRPTKEQKEHYAQWLLLWGKTLPCKYCRDNFTDNLSMAKFGNHVFKNRTTFSKFVYELHECVNTMLGKPPSGLSYDQVRDRYELLRSRCLTEKQKARKEAKMEELGCTEASPGVPKSRCVLRIVPRDAEIKTFGVDRRCRVKQIEGGGAVCVEMSDNEEQ